MTAQNITSGKNIIDATQNAFIEAAENVANIIETHETAAGEHEIFYLSAEFWVAVAFVVTVLLLSRPIYKAISGMINQRINNIRRRLDSAMQLQSDAEKLLASYERKFRNIDKEADAILKKSQNEIEYLRKASLSRLEQDMAQKEKDAAEKLSGAKDKATQEITAAVGTLSVKTVRKLLEMQLNDKEQTHLIDLSLKKLENL